MPVMVHTGTSIFPWARSKLADPMARDDAGQVFPDLTIVMGRGGRWLWCAVASCLLRRHGTVDLGFWGVRPPRLLEWFPRLEEIADKVLLGSGWPGPGIPGIREEIDGLRALPLSPRTIERILDVNASKVVK